MTTANLKQFEVCVNTAQGCTKAHSAEKFPIGTYICPECGEDLETRDTRSMLQKFGSKTGLKKVLPGIFGGGSQAAGSIVINPPASAGVAVAKLIIKIIGAGGVLFEADRPDLVIEHAYVWDDQNVVQPVVITNMTGGLEDGKITVGACSPWADWRPTLDLAPLCAHNIALGSDGQRLPVTVSGHMATIERNTMGEILITGEKTKNGPRHVSYNPGAVPEWQASDRLQPAETAVIADDDIYMMGDVIFRFNVE